MTSASTMVETVSKGSVRYVHQMAIYMVCNIFLFFLSSSLELTCWITLVQSLQNGLVAQILPARMLGFKYVNNNDTLVQKCKD